MRKFILFILLVLPLAVVAQGVKKPPERLNNFSIRVVDPSGTLLGDVTMLIYKAGNPDDVACSGYCGKVSYLPPGTYDILIEKGVLVKNIEVTLEGKAEKVIQYDRGTSEDWNLELRTLDAEGAKADAFYKLYRSGNPKDIYCYCSSKTVPRLKLPPGTYDVEVGFAGRLTPTRGIVIEPGKKVTKNILYEPTEQGGGRERTAPSNVTVDNRKTGHTLAIRWDNPTAEWFHYVEVYRSTSPDAEGELLLKTTYRRVNMVVDNWAEEGKTYYYTLRGVYRNKALSNFTLPAQGVATR